MKVIKKATYIHLNTDDDINEEESNKKDAESSVQSASIGKNTEKPKAKGLITTKIIKTATQVNAQNKLFT